MSIQTKRNILLCFNPVGTLYKPRPISAADYTGLALKCGLSDLEAVRLERALADSIVYFTSNEKGRDASTGSESYLRPGGDSWWRNVVNYAVKRALLPEQIVPAEIVAKILALASPAEGFTLSEQHLQQSLGRLRRTFDSCTSSGKNSFVDKLVVGAVENTRHPKNLERTSRVLSALGIGVAPLRYHHYAGLQTKPDSAGRIPDDVDRRRRQEKAAQRALADSVRRRDLRFGVSRSSFLRPFDLDFVCATRNSATNDPKPALQIAERLTAMMVTSKSPRRLPWAESEINRRDGAWLKMYVVNNSNKDMRGVIESGWTPVFLGDNSKKDGGALGATQPRPNWESLPRLSDTRLDPDRSSGWQLQEYRIDSVDELSRWLSEEIQPQRSILAPGVYHSKAINNLLRPAATKGKKEVDEKPTESGLTAEMAVKKVLEQRLSRRSTQTKPADLSKGTPFLLESMSSRCASQDNDDNDDIDDEVPFQRESPP